MTDYCGNCVRWRHECECNKPKHIFKVRYSYVVPESESVNVTAKDADEAEDIFFKKHTNGEDEIEIDEIKDLGEAKFYPHYNKNQLIFSGVLQ